MGTHDDFVSYIDEDGNKQDFYVKLLSTTDGLVKYQTLQGNIISIPLHRILKIKERGDQEVLHGKRRKNT